MNKTAKVLTENARMRIKKKNFALPGKGEGPEGKGSGSYPIPDAKHGRNALARASQQLKAGNLSQAEYDKIVAKVHAKYPSIGKAAALLLEKAGALAPPEFRRGFLDQLEKLTRE